MSKVADRNQRQLLELLKLPGNEKCADCRASNPRWASWDHGVFLCVQCAGLHRKLGTHITKVKSLTLDTWSKDQVDHMRAMGNITVNAKLNPDEGRNPPPRSIDESEREVQLERFIRAKYEYRSVVGRSAASESSSTSLQLPSSAKSPPIPRQSSPSISITSSTSPPIRTPTPSIQRQASPSTSPTLLAPFTQSARSNGYSAPSTTSAVPSHPPPVQALSLPPPRLHSSNSGGTETSVHSSPESIKHVRFARASSVPIPEDIVPRVPSRIDSPKVPIKGILRPRSAASATSESYAPPPVPAWSSAGAAAFSGRSAFGSAVNGVGSHPGVFNTMSHGNGSAWANPQTTAGQAPSTATSGSIWDNLDFLSGGSATSQSPFSLGATSTSHFSSTSNTFAPTISQPFSTGPSLYPQPAPSFNPSPNPAPVNPAPFIVPQRTGSAPAHLRQQPPPFAPPPSFSTPPSFTNPPPFSSPSLFDSMSQPSFFDSSSNQTKSSLAPAPFVAPQRTGSAPMHLRQPSPLPTQLPPAQFTPSLPPSDSFSPAPLRPQRTGFVPSSQFGQQLMQEQSSVPSYTPSLLTTSSFNTPSSQQSPFAPSPSPSTNPFMSNRSVSTPPLAQPVPQSATTNPFFSQSSGPTFGYSPQLQTKQNPYGGGYGQMASPSPLNPFMTGYPQYSGA